jgi:short-subunit dehydrogenase
MSDSRDLQSVLITGASGGFGIEFARQIEASGYRLILHGRDPVRLQMTLGSLKYPERHSMVEADLNAKKGLSTLISSVSDELLIGLVNNAGFGIWGSFEQTGVVPQIDVIKTDLKAPIALTHALLPRLLKNGGFIINVSSLAGESAMPYMSTYAAAKAGLTYWSEALRAIKSGTGWPGTRSDACARPVTYWFPGCFRHAFRVGRWYFPHLCSTYHPCITGLP